MQIAHVQALRKSLMAAALAISIGSVFGPTAAAQAQACFIYVANNNPSVSIYSVDADTGSLADAGTASLRPMSSAFTLAINPAQTFLYVGDNSGAGTWGFAIDAASGALTPLDGSPFPVFNSNGLAVDPSGSFLVAALGGNVSSYRIDAVTGGLMFASFAGGGTPWSLTFEPLGRFVYVANVNSNTVSGFRLNADTGELAPVPGSPFSAGANPFRVVIDPSGKFLYVSNANGSSLSAYNIDSDTGALSPIPGSSFPTGQTPEAMAIDPSGKYLYVATAPNVIDGFSIDPDNGTLVPLDGSPFPAGDNYASDLRMDPSGQFLYAANHDARKVTVLAVDPTTGSVSLSSAIGSPGFPLSIALVTCPAGQP